MRLKIGTLVSVQSRGECYGLAIILTNTNSFSCYRIKMLDSGITLDGVPDECLSKTSYLSELAKECL